MVFDMLVILICAFVTHQQLHIMNNETYQFTQNKVALRISEQILA